MAEERFGPGEFERTDLKVPPSVWARRYEFLRTLIRQRSDIFDDLFSLANIENPHPVDAKLNDSIFFLFFTYCFRNNPLNFQPDPNWLDTPFLTYVAFIDSQEAILLKMENKLRNEGYSRFDAPDLRRIAIYKKFPGWESFKKQKKATSAIRSIESWAVVNNLNEPWILDLILLAFNRLLTSVGRRDLGINIADIDANAISYCRFEFELKVSQGLWSASGDFHGIEIGNRMFSDMVQMNLPPFEFRYRGFTARPETWFPNVQSRRDFIDEYKLRFWREHEARRELIETIPWSEAAIAKELAIYWDESERAYTSGSRLYILPYSLEFEHTLTLIHQLWSPDIAREKFIDRSIKQFRERLFAETEAHRKLANLSKSRLAHDLAEYCNGIEKLMPSNYARTPSMYGTKQDHFGWLVEYQLTQTLSFRQMASKHLRTPEAIRKAIQTLAGELGLTMRAAHRGGRPSGLKEARIRFRASK